MQIYDLGLTSQASGSERPLASILTFSGTRVLLLDSRTTCLDDIRYLLVVLVPTLNPCAGLHLRVGPWARLRLQQVYSGLNELV
jgi:hypothetical protein